jgi:hypothetical protein
VVLVRLWSAPTCQGCSYVRENLYKHGNPRKNSINKEIGSCIRKAIGGQVTKSSDGKPIKIPVLGSVIQSYTEVSRRR